MAGAIEILQKEDGNKVGALSELFFRFLDSLLWLTDHFRSWAVALAITAFAFLTPIHSILFVVGVLIFSDLILGVWAAKKTNVPITSARLRDSVSKMFIYLLVIILGYLVESYLVGLVPISKLTASVIGVVEMKSVYENAGIILGRPLFQELIIKLGSKNRD